MIGSIGGGMSSTSTSTQNTAPNYKARVPDIEAARRLMLGDIMNQYGSNPYGSADMSFGAPQGGAFQGGVDLLNVEHRGKKEKSLRLSDTL